MTWKVLTRVRQLNSRIHRTSCGQNNFTILCRKVLLCVPPVLSILNLNVRWQVLQVTVLKAKTAIHSQFIRENKLSTHLQYKNKPSLFQTSIPLDFKKEFSLRKILEREHYKDFKYHMQQYEIKEVNIDAGNQQVVDQMKKKT